MKFILTITYTAATDDGFITKSEDLTYPFNEDGICQVGYKDFQLLLNWISGDFHRVFLKGDSLKIDSINSYGVSLNTIYIATYQVIAGKYQVCDHDIKALLKMFTTPYIKYRWD